MSELGTVERAYQLAPSCRTIEEIRRKLRREGYSSIDEHMASGSLRKELLKLCRAAE